MYLFFVVHLYKVVLIIQNTLVDSYIKKFLWPKCDTFWLNGIKCTKICKLTVLSADNLLKIILHCYFHLKYVKQKLNRGFRLIYGFHEMDLDKCRICKGDKLNLRVM